MHNPLSGLKLRTQLILLLLTSILFLVIVQVAYYYRFYNVTKERSLVNTNNLIGQIEEKITSNLEDIKRIAQLVIYNQNIPQYLTSTEPLAKLQLNLVADNILKYAKNSNKAIYNIVIFDNNGNSLLYNDSINNNVLSEITSQYESKIQQDFSPFFSSLITTKESDHRLFSYFMPIYDLNDFSNVHKKVGTAIIICNSDYFQDAIRKISLTPNSHFVLLDENNMIAAGDIGSKSGSRFDLEAYYTPGEKGRAEQLIKGEKYLVQCSNISGMTWKIVSTVSLKDMTQDMVNIRSFGILAGLTTILFLSLLGYSFIATITKSIYRLIRFIDNDKNLNLNQRITLVENNEIGHLAKYINKMFDDIEQMTNRILTTQSNLYKAELSKKQAQLVTLQSQINPHFLYNTLDCLKSIGLAAKVPEIVDISTSMAKMFRYSIKGNDFVTVKDEIQSILDYFKIISIRFCGRFEIVVDVDQRVYDVQIPKMILQPLVENAVYHGLERKRGKGLVTIKGQVVSGCSVLFEIIDNGLGMKPALVEKLNKSLESSIEEESFNPAERGIGLVNTCKRIRINCGETYGLRVFSTEGEGTKIILSLPFSVPK